MGEGRSGGPAGRRSGLGMRSLGPEGSFSLDLVVGLFIAQM